MLTNALQLRISVMPTLTVLTPMVHTTVLVNQDILEMDTTVQVRSSKVITCCSEKCAERSIFNIGLFALAFAFSLEFWEKPFF